MADPVAIDDLFAVDEDATLLGNVLDDNGGGADSDPDGDALTVSLISGPDYGVLTLNDDGSFSYEADDDAFDLAAPGDVVPVSFVYQIDDGNGGVSQATATIDVTILDEGVTLFGGNGDQLLDGTDGGEDYLYGGNGRDTLNGLDGADTLRGGNAKDYLYGGDGADLLKGGRSTDYLYGGTGDDTLKGENGKDYLYGEDGDDVLWGGKGPDVLAGGAGDDILLGGEGRDRFVINPGEGADIIGGFEEGNRGKDVIDLRTFGAQFDTFADVLAAASQVGDDVFIDFGGGDSVTLANVDLGDLKANDFILG